MTGEERKQIILQKINDESNGSPVSATTLASLCNVSRQIIVSDIALLRASGYNIIATNKGYIIDKPLKKSRIFKVHHSDDDLLTELYGIVDLGGEIIDVFINHKAYGQVRAELNINTRRKANEFVEKIKTGKSTPLKNITSNYHYHTILADTDEILDDINNFLKSSGFLVEKEQTTYAN